MRTGMLMLSLLGAAWTVRPVTAAGAGDRRADVRRLLAVSRELTALEAEMATLQAAVGLPERGYFTPEEQDRIEAVFFRYLTCRSVLWDIVNRYREGRAEIEIGDAVEAEEFVLAFNAALKLACYSSRLVLTFVDEPRVAAKLNEAQHRYAIETGTYERIFKSTTDVGNLRALRTARELFQREMASEGTGLQLLATTPGVYQDLVRECGPLFAQTDRQIQSVLEQRSLLLPDVRNRIRHSEITKLALQARDLFKGNLYAVRGVLFSRIGGVHLPRSSALRLDDRQLARLRRKLRPGDVILTFSSGYMSNVFLPGRFKHGITYVGTPEQRRRAGLTPAAVAALPEAKQAAMREAFEQDTLEDGTRAEVIEAVAEGVIFNSLDHVLQEHVQRFVVLRPRLTDGERLEALATVFALLGAGYDFQFDFTDSTYLCCTEVIYRALNGRGHVAFTLTRRAGTETLSADDILAVHVGSEPAAFDFVAFGWGAAGSPLPGVCPAELVEGRLGHRRLKRFLVSGEL